MWVVTGLLGVVVGLAVGFAVGARFWVRPWNYNWVEAWGTWVGALATLLAVVLAAVLVFFSDEFNRRRAMQRAADRVFCDIRAASRFAFAVGDRTGSIDQLEIEVNNRSGNVVTDVVCELRLGESQWSYKINEPIATDKTVTQQFELEVGH